MSKHTPPGWKLTPVEPTPRMLIAAVSWREVDADDEITDEWLSMADRIYRAMLAAAPAQPDRDAEPAAWLQIGVGPHKGECMARLHKPATWNSDWWRFEPLYTAVAAPAEWATLDPSFVLHHLKVNTNFDADVIGKMLAFAKGAASKGHA